MTEELTDDDLLFLRELADHPRVWDAQRIVKQYWHLQDKGLVTVGPDHWIWRITDKGREVAND